MSSDVYFLGGGGGGGGVCGDCNPFEAVMDAWAQSILNYSSRLLFLLSYVLFSHNHARPHLFIRSSMTRTLLGRIPFTNSDHEQLIHVHPSSLSACRPYIKLISSKVTCTQTNSN